MKLRNLATFVATLTLTTAVAAVEPATRPAAPAAQPAATAPTPSDFRPAPGDPLRDEREKHLSHVRQLTMGGENAEAYFSADGKKLVLQRRLASDGCDQIFVLDLATGGLERISNGQGRTTCAYFYPDDKRVIYASTHLGSAECLKVSRMVDGHYVWPIYASYDLYAFDFATRNTHRLTEAAGYDAEATVAPDGHRVVFTSVRDGDLELYSMAADGSDVKRLTRSVGYDGGAFFSPDSKRIVYRSSRLTDDAEIKTYRELLARELVEPSRLEICVMDEDGSNVKQVTKNGGANFCPYFTPDGHRIIYSSNQLDLHGHAFDLFLIKDDGTGLERVTWHPDFDGFPMFSPDGKRLVWGSNRNGTDPGETNIFIADWVE